MPSTGSAAVRSETKGPSAFTTKSPARRPFRWRRRVSPDSDSEIAPSRTRSGVPGAGDGRTARKISSAPLDMVVQYQSVPLRIFCSVVWVGKRSLSTRTRSGKLSPGAGAEGGCSRGRWRRARSGSSTTSQ